MGTSVVHGSIDEAARHVPQAVARWGSSAPLSASYSARARSIDLSVPMRRGRRNGWRGSARVYKPPKAFRRRCSPDLRAHQMVLSQILDVLDGAEPVFGADAEFH